jgi:hypothetical protein
MPMDLSVQDTGQLSAAANLTAMRAWHPFLISERFGFIRSFDLPSP